MTLLPQAVALVALEYTADDVAMKSRFSYIPGPLEQALCSLSYWCLWPGHAALAMMQGR